MSGGGGGGDSAVLQALLFVQQMIFFAPHVVPLAKHLPMLQVRRYMHGLSIHMSG